MALTLDALQASQLDLLLQPASDSSQMLPCSASDEDLLRAVAGGDVSAVGILYDLYSTTIFPVAVRIVRSRIDAEDIVHDVFVAVAEEAAKYDPKRGSVGAWLNALVRNLSIDHVRKRNRRELIARDLFAYEPSVPAHSPETLAAETGERRALLVALHSLPEPMRTILERSFFEGLTYPELASQAGVPLGTIKSRAARAFSLLKVALR